MIRSRAPISAARIQSKLRALLRDKNRHYLIKLLRQQAFALTVAGSLLIGASANAFPAIELSDIVMDSNQGGFVINGVNANDFSGRSVSGAGDVNGDGLVDVIVGAFGADPRGRDEAGASYVIFGTADGTAVELSTIASGVGGFAIHGVAAGDNSGRSVSGAGDVNGDGFDDLIVGADGANPGAAAWAGESYVVFGKADGVAVELSSVAGGTGGFVIHGIDIDDASGYSVSGAGDVNGDGLDDLIVGAFGADPGGTNLAGESYVVFGKTDGAAVELSAIAGGTGGFIINGIDAGDFSGFSVSDAGDVNGDGLDDLVVGAWRTTSGIFTGVGESYVVFGKTNGTAVELSTVAAGIGGFVINGIGERDVAGFSVSGAGDVNGDGFDDLIIGAMGVASPRDQFTGESYVVFGKADGAAVDLFSVTAGVGGFVLYGIDSGDYSGFSVSGAGDVNGDGLGDLIVGAWRADPNGIDKAGESYVVLGKADGVAVELSAIAAGAGGFVINGVAAYDESGVSVSGAGDVNGDGVDDLLIGAFGADPGGRYSAGASYVVFSPLPPPRMAPIELSEISMDTNAGGFVVNGIDSRSVSGASVSGAGDVNGDGLDDVIIGAPRSYMYDLPVGKSYVVFGKVDGTTVDLSAISAGLGGFIINGIDSHDNSGGSVSGAGDVNGDGLDDLIVGASGGDPNVAFAAGESYVVFGKADGTAVDLREITAGLGGFVINGIDKNDASGASVSGAGDVNGDGLDDLIIGAPRGAPGGRSWAGESYVVFGKADGTAVELSAVTAGTGGFLINGIDLSDQSGSSVSGAGDVNGDGLADVIIGISQSYPRFNFYTGESYVVFGKADGTVVELSMLDAGAGGFLINGIDLGDQSGSSVSGAGDVNGDGLDDLIVGAKRADAGGVDAAGESYIVFGKADGTTVELSTIAIGIGGFVINGIDLGDHSGVRVSGAGDVNGDGLADLIVGASGGDPGGLSDAGESYLVFGKMNGTAVELSAVTGGLGGFVINGIDADDFSGRVSGAGDVNGDGLDDLIIGAAGGDPGGRLSAGESYVVFSPVVLPAPRKAWVDFTNVGAEDGTYTQPFNTLLEAGTVVADEGVVNIKGDTMVSDSAETIFIEKPMRIDAINGPVIVGTP